MSRTADDENTAADPGWLQARNQLFRMIMEGRSFSGRERNCCFLNTGQGRFATISGLSGIDFPDDGRCIAVTDWDRDGDQDLWISNRNAPRLRFLQNESRTNHHFVALKLVGNGTTTNRDAIGARVEVRLQAADPQIGQTSTESGVSEGQGATSTADGRRFIQTLRAGEGFMSQSSKWLHFGLGDVKAIDRIVVHWPGGQTREYFGLEADRRYRVLQDGDAVEAVDSPAASQSLAEGESPLPPETRTTRVALVSRVPMPAVVYTDPDGMVVTDEFTTGTPTLVNLWATWCLPCMQELTEFADQRQAFVDAGLRVVSLSVDQLAGRPGSTAQASPSDVAGVVRQIGYAFPWGSVDAAQMTLLQQLHDQFFFLKRPLPLPSSFLVDADGRLAMIYTGPVTVEQLQADVQRATRGYQPTALDAACFPGRTIDHPRVLEVAQRSDLQTRFHVAVWLEESGRYDNAIENFGELNQLDPAWALPYRHLAKLYLKRNELSTAKGYIERAIQLEPDSAAAHNTLGLIHSEQGNAATAEDYLRAAIRLDPQFAEAQNNLGTILASQGKIAAARDCFERAVELDDQFAEAHTNLGSAYAAANDIRRAIVHYERAIQINPVYVDAHNNLGTMYARQGNFESAIRQYRQVLRLQPNHRDARRNLELAERMLKADQRPLRPR